MIVLLHEMTPEAILHEMEIRSDELLRAEEIVGDLETNLKAYEASKAIAWRDSGKSMSEAEARVRSTPEWADLYRSLQQAQADAARARRHYRRAEIATDLWRTQQATHRKV